MDIRIGFTDGAREVALQSDRPQKEVLAEVNAAVEKGDGMLQLTDKKGKVVLARVERIAWVEVGTAKASHVGFTVGPVDSDDL